MKITKTVFGQSKEVLVNDTDRDGFDNFIKGFCSVKDNLNIVNHQIIDSRIDRGDGRSVIFEFGYSDRFSYDNFVIDLEN